MCELLAGLRESMAGFAAGFDPALLPATDTSSVLEDAAAIEKMAATVKALTAAWLADTGGWRRSGDRSAAHHLARTTGSSVGAAVEAIQTARMLEQLPETAAAARRGELSASQTAAIAAAASANPGAEFRCWHAPGRRRWPSCATSAPRSRPRPSRT